MNAEVNIAFESNDSALAERVYIEVQKRLRELISEGSLSKAKIVFVDYEKDGSTTSYV